MKPRSLFALCLILLLCVSCVGPSSAELATYNTIGPDHKVYVKNDPKLDVDQKRARFDLIESWRIRVGGAK